MGKNLKKLDKEQSSHIREHTVYKKNPALFQKTTKLFMIKSNTLQSELRMLILQTITCRWTAVNFSKILQAGMKINQCRKGKKIQECSKICMCYSHNK